MKAVVSPFIVSVVAAFGLVGCGGLGSATTATVRAYNTIAGLDSATITAAGTTLLADSGYKTYSPYTSIIGSASASVTLADSSGSTQASLSTSLLAGTAHSIFAVNTTSSPELLCLEDDVTLPSSSYTRVRFLMLSPTSGAVDVYVTDSSSDISSATANYSSLTFKSANTFEKASGTYKVTVTNASTKTVLATYTGTFNSQESSQMLFLDSTSGGSPRTLLKVVN